MKTLMIQPLAKRKSDPLPYPIFVNKESGKVTQGIFYVKNYTETEIALLFIRKMQPTERLIGFCLIGEFEIKYTVEQFVENIKTIDKNKLEPVITNSDGDMFSVKGKFEYNLCP